MFNERSILNEAQLEELSLCRAVSLLMPDGSGKDDRKLRGCLEAEVSARLERLYGAPTQPGAFRFPGEWLAHRDLTVASGSGGGFLVQTDNLVGLTIETQRPRSIAGRFGVKVVRPNTATTIPRITASQPASWLGTESTAAPEEDFTLGQIAVTPKVVATTIQLSQQQVRMGGPERDAVVASDLRSRILEALDRAVLNGTGAGGAPLGVLLTPGIGAVAGTTLARAGCVELQTDVGVSDMLSAAPDRVGYVAPPAVASLLMNRQKFTGSNDALWEGHMADGRIAGAPAISTTACPAATMVFGDWGQLVIAEYDGGSIELSVDPYSDFRTGIVTIRVVARYDIFLRKPGAFSVATSIT
jgi:HK97 family phage major capsid protein